MMIIWYVCYTISLNNILKIFNKHVDSIRRKTHKLDLESIKAETKRRLVAVVDVIEVKIID